MSMIEVTKVRGTNWGTTWEDSRRDSGKRA
jgi:hypothetical protein